MLSHNSTISIRVGGGHICVRWPKERVEIRGERRKERGFKGKMREMVNFY